MRIHALLLSAAILAFSGVAQAEVSWEADSGDWYHNERIAISMAKTRARNGVYKYCRENNARLDSSSWQYDGLNGSHCDTKQSRMYSDKTLWNCRVTASAECYTR